METHLVFLQLAEEYIGASRSNEKYISPAVKCLNAVINSKTAPITTTVLARLMLAKFLLQETGNAKYVEPIIAKGIQDATMARLYELKLELCVVMASISDAKFNNSPIQDALTLGHERLYYSLVLLKIRRYWHSKNTKDQKEMMRAVKLLQDDNLIAIQLLAVILEGWYQLTQCNNVQAAESCLSRLDDGNMQYCPPQYMIMKELLTIQAAMQRGLCSTEQRDALGKLDSSVLNTDGFIYISTFQGFTVEVQWLTRQQVAVLIALYQGVVSLFCDLEQAVPLFNQAINQIDRIEQPEGFGFGHRQQVHFYKELRHMAGAYLVQAYFMTGKWNDGLNILNQLEQGPMVSYLKACFSQARGRGDEARSIYNEIRQTAPQHDDLYILSTINLLFLNNMYSDHTGQPQSSTPLKKELEKLLSSHDSELFVYAWHLLKFLYDDNGNIANIMTKLYAPQLRCISSTLTIPYTRVEPGTQQRSQLESAFSNAFFHGKMISAVMWVRIAGVLRRQRYLQNNDTAKATYYDEKLINNASIHGLINEQINY